MQNRRLFVWGAALVVGLGFVGARRASGETAPDDGAPSGMVAFVEGGACPPGWVPVYDIEGRVVVGAISAESVGVQVGSALGDQEEREHGHTFEGEIELPKKDVAGANGGNNEGAAAAKYAISGEAAKATTGLPFVQVQGCVKP